MTMELTRARPEKVLPRHQERQAVVYVRQSTPWQVVEIRESTRLQYGLADRACGLGWRSEQVTIIDDDLGRSGSSALDRPGFQRLVAEVGLGHVGLVLGIEVSRLARSCCDWHQLLEMCALFDTLIGDADGIYDPGTYNDRLLLGLKGTMSEMRECSVQSAWSSLSSSGGDRSAVCCVISSTMTCNYLIACGAGRTREMSAGIVPIARRYRICCAIRPMLAPTPSGVATMMAVAGFRVSRIVVDLIYVIRRNGWYSTKMRCRRI
ncbi:MAG: hypothetical protein C0494_11695 [Sphingobium sp.]|nr:hypothetical protein [Sphingobium sp.]